MPSERPGRRETVVRSDKAGNPELRHNDPVIENNLAGVAAKSRPGAAGAVTAANAAANQVIADGETFVVMLDGNHTLDDSHLPAGAVEGSRLYIEAATDALVLEATALTGGVLEAGYAKFGVVTDIDATLDRFDVNLNERASF